MSCRHLLAAAVFLVFSVFAAGQADSSGASSSQGADTTAAAAAVATGHADPQLPGIIEWTVDTILQLFDVRGSENTWQHYTLAACILIVAFLGRRIGTQFLFALVRRFTERTKSTLDDKLLPAFEEPVKTFIALFGIYVAIRVLKLPPELDRDIGYGATVAFSLATFWLFLRGFHTVLDHAHEIAREKKLGVAAFMPWIKKTLSVVFVIFGVLMVAQSMGFEVRAFLAGLGLGGLAFALAAQDTLANLFGSVVVAVDQPFKVGEFVQIGAHLGLVEDIGLRSTKLRTPAKSLITIPNRTVAAEAITNLSRFTQRRVEQVVGLTYDTTAEQMDAMVEEIRGIITGEEEVDPASVMVFFRDYSASSLDIWIVYLTKDPDFQKHMRLRQRINLKIMRAVQARGLSFALPSQTVYLGGEAAQRLLAPRTPQGSV